MSDANLLTQQSAPLDGARPGSGKPPFLPDKFWDSKRREPRLEALARSYVELERRGPFAENTGPMAGPGAGLGAEPGDGVPASPDEYRIDLIESFLGSDPDLNRRLHAAGFSNAQAQLVYDLAAEKMIPVIQSIAAQYARSGDAQRLEAEFGGPDRWRQVQRQIQKWGSRNLPLSAYSALASSFKGVMAMHRMMNQGDEPDILRDGGEKTGPVSEKGLRKMMRDPRYWRDKDPTFIQKVADGFKELYPN